MKSFFLTLALAIVLPTVAHAADTPAAPKKPCCCCKEMKDKDCCADRDDKADHAGHEGMKP